MVVFWLWRGLRGQGRSYGGVLVRIDGCTWLKGDALEAFVDCACKGPEVVEVA